ncbi:MAG: coenzyme F420-0:L-glutamate ligase [Gammaproteobacteria bacterium]|nr:coenzyme F420-0:L-glutamate ligase [Gammaproteobacteria bacterium]
MPEVRCGDPLDELLADRLRRDGWTLQAFDILVVAQKIVSKAEGRQRDLDDVAPTAQAERLAALTGKDPRLVQLVLDESTAVLRTAPDVLIVRHRLGYVMANAGIDRSNVPAGPDGRERVLLLPVDPDRSAARLRGALQQSFGLNGPFGVVISDSFGRPWRQGVVNIAIGAAGLPALLDRRGEPDRDGRRLAMTEVGFADAVAAAAGLAMGEAAESTPAVLLRGLRWHAAERPAAALIRPLEQDLFQ